MLTIRSSADLRRVLQRSIDPHLARLLRLRVEQLGSVMSVDLASLAHFIVAERSDALAQIEAEAGFPLAGEEAPIEWAQVHPTGWIEVAIITDDEGFAVVVFAREDADRELIAALLAHA